MATCTRYQTDGSNCPNTTQRADGWCGQCDGYTRPTPLPESKSWWFAPCNWQAAQAPLYVDEIPEVSVSLGAIRSFVQRHGTTEQAAEAQIRSLIEDCLIAGVTLREPRGYWRLEPPVAKARGYGLKLSPDGGTVVGYMTRHRDRTYAQTASGIESRASMKRRRAPARLV